MLEHISSQDTTPHEYRMLNSKNEQPTTILTGKRVYRPSRF
jgi:phenylalanyl-tRNA synthetase alpha subunit